MPEEVTKPKEKEVLTKPANCMKCNKPLKAGSWYYRNMGYYCGKRCWKLAVAEAKEKEQKEKEKKDKG